jgi:Dna[CI] antecedent, DciA
MRNSRSLSELLARGGNKLSLLKARSKERSAVLTEVRAALPERLAQYVMSAGVDQGRLTVGVVGAVWASRLRYSTELMRARVAKALGQEITAVRIRVVG